MPQRGHLRGRIRSDGIVGCQLILHEASAEMANTSTLGGVTTSDGADVAERPTTVVAITVNVYCTPAVNPVTVQLVDGTDTVHVAPPGDAVTEYCAIGDPPSLEGAIHDTVA